MCLHSLFCRCMYHFSRTIYWRDYFFSTLLSLLCQISIDYEWKSLVQVWLFATPWTVDSKLLCPWDSPARIPEWVCMPSSRESSPPRDQPTFLMSSAVASRLFTTSAPVSPHLCLQGYGVCSPFPSGLTVGGQHVLSRANKWTQSPMSTVLRALLLSLHLGTSGIK